MNLEAVAALRAQCDRLVLGVAGGEGEALARAAEVEALDLVCDFGEAAGQDMVALLRPDVVIEDF